MTNEQINTAIAETCGWTEISSDGVVGRAPGETCNRVMFLPRYCNDLNAMHEAEKTLRAKQFKDYLMELLDFIDEPILANARQRAEAFLRTLDRWKSEN